jgi:biotin-dependent carboxylase-like uncharacterized protein
MGLRYYVTVRGGIDVEPQLGSRSRDVLTGLGPEPIRAGDRLPVGSAPCTEIPAVDLLTVPAPPGGTVTIMVHGGPRSSWFSAESVDAFYDTEWMVSPESNRIGARLVAASPTAATDGGIFERIIERELPSEAMVAGAIQVPPSGIPTVLLADHPVTGGYPVIAVVADASLDAFGQLRPGQTVTFRHAH